MSHKMPHHSVLLAPPAFRHSPITLKMAPVCFPITLLMVKTASYSQSRCCIEASTSCQTGSKSSSLPVLAGITTLFLLKYENHFIAHPKMWAWLNKASYFQALALAAVFRALTGSSPACLPVRRKQRCVATSGCSCQEVTPSK